MATKRQLPAGYASLEPLATYSPWQTDGDFSRAYEKVKDHTLVDQYRCYMLWQMALQQRHIDGDILEVGVWRGGTGALLKQALSGGSKKVWLADTFEGVVKAGPRDLTYRGGEHADTSRETVENLLASVEGAETAILTGIFPDDTAHELGNTQFCMCHIDVDVYQSALDILNWLWPRLNSGGTVVFDDYGFFGCEGVTALGDELLAAAVEGKVDYLFYYNLSGQAVLVKR